MNKCINCGNPKRPKGATTFGRGWCECLGRRRSLPNLNKGCGKMLKKNGYNAPCGYQHYMNGELHLCPDCSPNLNNIQEGSNAN